VIPHLRKLANALIDAVYPPICMLCGTSLGEGPHQFMFCGLCKGELCHNPHTDCPRCSSSIGTGVDASDGCANCRATSFAFASSFRLGAYDGKLREAILKMKHLSGESLAEMLGSLWVEQQLLKFQALNAQVVLPIPLHYFRQWRRGYNQAAALARMVANRLAVPCPQSWLKRNRHTPMQIEPSPAARRENVRGAFKLTRLARIHGKRVLLIDDVLTTGATLDAAARVIHGGGAAQVDVAVLAHR
jgi:ComF family protein